MCVHAHRDQFKICISTSQEAASMSTVALQVHELHRVALLETGSLYIYSTCYVAQLAFNYQSSGLKSPKYWDQW